MFEAGIFQEQPTWFETDFVVKITATAVYGARTYYAAIEQVPQGLISSSGDTTPAPLYQDHPNARLFVLPTTTGGPFLTEINNRQLNVNDLVRVRHKTETPLGTVFEAEVGSGAPGLVWVAVTSGTPQTVTPAAVGSSPITAYPAKISAISEVTGIAAATTTGWFYPPNGEVPNAGTTPNFARYLCKQEGSDGSGKPIWVHHLVNTTNYIRNVSNPAGLGGTSGGSGTLGTLVIPAPGVYLLWSSITFDVNISSGSSLGQFATFESNIVTTATGVTIQGGYSTLEFNANVTGWAGETEATITAIGFVLIPASAVPATLNLNVTWSITGSGTTTVSIEEAFWGATAISGQYGSLP